MSADEDTRPLFLRELRPRAEPKPVPTGPTAQPGTATAYAIRALENELDTLQATPEGGRNHQLNVSAFNLAQLVAAGHLDRLATWNNLTEVAESIGLNGHETYATLTSAFRAAQPRHVAELEAVPSVTVIAAPEPAEVDELSPLLDWPSLWKDSAMQEWIVEPILPARRYVAMYSPPKVGKSLLMLEMAVAISRGTEVLGTKPDRARRVLYVDFENDPVGDVRTRLIAMGYGPADLTNLYYLSYPRLPYLDTQLGGQTLLALCQEHEAEVVVIDTISRAVKGEENDNDTWLSLYRHTGMPLKNAGITTIRLDHTGKDQSKGMRGGSAKYGDVDAVWSMTPISDTTLKLECTAHRLPISEKVLVLERKLDPLRHEVDGGGPMAIAGARGRQLVAHLSEIYGDQTPPSLKDACKKLRERGHGARFEYVREAISARELTFNRLPYGEDS